MSVTESISPPYIEGRVLVRDGRKLGFAEFGTPGGRPVLWLHGTPGARRQIPEGARRAARELGVRLIGVDRPGTGLSSSHLCDSVLDLTVDIGLLLDRLAVGEAGVIALSGGGPYALACAAAMPERVRSVVILGGVAPTCGPDAPSGGLVRLARPFAPIFQAMRVPLGAVLSAAVVGLRPLSHPALMAFARLSPAGDRSVLERPEMEAMFVDDLTDTGGRLRAPIDDIILFSRDWGFRLGDVRAPVLWWHGDEDQFVPVEHGRHCASLLADASFEVRPGDSHLSGLAAAEEVLEHLLDAWDRSEVPPREAAVARR